MRSRITDPIWAFFGRNLAKPLILLGLAFALLYGAHFWLSPAPDRLEAIRRQLAERVCNRVLKDLPKGESTRSLALLDIAGDNNGMITELLREKIRAAGEYRLLDDSFFNKLMGEFGKEGVQVSHLSDALSIARQIGVDLVMFGELGDLKANGQASKIDLDIRMAERQSGQAVFAGRYAESRDRPDTWHSRIVDSPAGRRILIWVAFTLLLPVLSISLVRQLTAQDSNLFNLIMLAGYTIADMLVALLLTDFWMAGVWTAALLVFALAVSLFYNYWIASFVEGMSH